MSLNCGTHDFLELVTQSNQKYHYRKIVALKLIFSSWVMRFNGDVGVIVEISEGPSVDGWVYCITMVAVDRRSPINP